MRVAIVVVLVALLPGTLYSQSALPEPGELRPIFRDRDTTWLPAWSPDGRSIAFNRQPWVRDPSHTDIWLVAPDGSSPRRLTAQVSGEHNTRSAWSPDGRQIAYYRIARGVGRIWIMNADGTGARALPEVGTSTADPTWSPDGRKIAFAAQQDRNWDIYFMNADGSGVTRLTDSPDNERLPVFLPDGTKIVYEWHGQLRLLDINTRESRGVTIGPNHNHHVVSFDGKYIAYRSRRAEGVQHLWLMATADVLEGMVPDARARQLTVGPDVFDSGPTFAPDGTRIAFIRQVRTAGEWSPGEIWLMTLR